MKQIPALLFLLFPVQAAEPDIEMLKDTLVANADSFDRLEIQADGSTTDFAVSLGTEAVELDGNTYDGFRFKCPEEIPGKDFVWYFNAPEHWGNWYIFAVEGKPGQAFRNWIDANKIYSPFDKSPEKKRLRILQTLGGGYFKPGGEYLMWFRKMGDGADTSLRGTAAFAGEREKWDHEDVEKALKLRPAPAEEQVTALGSRGGLILLDTRLFERNDAERRIESAFTSIRSTKQSSDGFFVTMQIAVPPCTTSPLLADIVREHGEPDFVRTSAEMQQVRQHAGGSPGDEDEAITSYHYDYFAFETKTGAKNPKITRVRTFGCDFSDVAPPAKGSGYSSIGIENLTIFHRDGKEVGRAYYSSRETRSRCSSPARPKVNTSRITKP